MCKEAHAAGKVKEWGVSNFTAWQVVQVVAYCKEHGIAQPTVYQGSYHVLQRQAEDELLPALRSFGIRYCAFLAPVFQLESCCHQEDQCVFFVLSPACAIRRLLAASGRAAYWQAQIRGVTD